MTGHYTVQSGFGIAMGAGLSITSLVLFFIRKNQNSRKTLYFLLTLLGALVAMQYSSNYTVDKRIDVDGKIVDWEQPIYVGLQGALLSVVLGIFFGIELPIVGALVLLVTAAATFWEFSAISGSAANQKPDAMYLCFAIAAMFWLFVLKVWSIFTHQNATMWIFMIASFLGTALLTGAWFGGSAFLDTLPSLNIQSGVGLIGTAVLFFLIPIGVIIFHGDKPIINALMDAKHKIMSAV